MSATRCSDCLRDQSLAASLGHLFCLGVNRTVGTITYIMCIFASVIVAIVLVVGGIIVLVTNIE